MPRFFFHVHNDIVSRDEEGVDLSDRAAAVDEARRGARSLAAEQVLRRGRLALGHFIEIEDETGALVAKITFADAVAVER